jgi:hypothetical protein
MIPPNTLAALVQSHQFCPVCNQELVSSLSFQLNGSSIEFTIPLEFYTYSRLQNLSNTKEFKLHLKTNVYNNFIESYSIAASFDANCAWNYISPGTLSNEYSPYQNVEFQYFCLSSHYKQIFRMSIDLTTGYVCFLNLLQEELMVSEGNGNVAYLIKDANSRAITYRKNWGTPITYNLDFPEFPIEYKSIIKKCEILTTFG